MNIKTLVIDLAKNVFQLHGVDKAGKVVLRKRLTRGKLAEFVVNLPPCLIELEACGSAHYGVQQSLERKGTLSKIILVYKSLYLLIQYKFSNLLIKQLECCILFD